ncbi:DUF5789 family protein [Haladaptatus sp. NG-SE-30]
MTNGSDDTREQGIEFGTLIGDLEDESYPLSHETLLSRYGDRELGLFDTQVPLREVLSPEQELEYEEWRASGRPCSTWSMTRLSVEKSTATAAGMPPTMTT